ncbi:MAG: hypothetical protein JST87_04610 [Bacteroidetes bacterium]|nr:hypothetical protein [Bacteroidota bacterium]
MTRLLFSICCVLFISTSFGQKSDALLFNAYKKNSLTELQSFFDNWALETPSISAEDFKKLNDTLKNVYQVFQSFYNPTDINRTGGSEWGNDIYKGVKYFLVQDKIFYAVADGLITDTIELHKGIFHRPKSYDSLNDFRPELSFLNIKCVILNKYYDGLLNRFLGDQHYKLGTVSIMSPARSKGESENRMKFLENCIKIWYGHWGGYWQLHSYPYAGRVTFDKDFQNAVVDYQMIYEGGYAYFKKISDKWTLIKAERTWIE